MDPTSLSLCLCSPSKFAIAKQNKRLISSGNYDHRDYTGKIKTGILPVIDINNY
jgi:hypothetical protein